MKAVALLSCFLSIFLFFFLSCLWFKIHLMLFPSFSESSCLISALGEEISVMDKIVDDEFDPIPVLVSKTSQGKKRRTVSQIIHTTLLILV